MRVRVCVYHVKTATGVVFFISYYFLPFYLRFFPLVRTISPFLRYLTSGTYPHTYHYNFLRTHHTYRRYYCITRTGWYLPSSARVNGDGWRGHIVFGFIPIEKKKLIIIKKRSVGASRCVCMKKKEKKLRPNPIRPVKIVGTCLILVHTLCKSCDDRPLHYIVPRGGFG